MILYYILVTLFVILCFLLAMIILIQRGKGSLGIFHMGGATQMLFGGSGGQDLFQKITWVMGGLFMVGSLALAIMKSSTSNNIDLPQPTPFQSTEQLPLD